MVCVFSRKKKRQICQYIFAYDATTPRLEFSQTSHLEAFEHIWTHTPTSTRHTLFYVNYDRRSALTGAKQAAITGRVVDAMGSCFRKKNTHTYFFIFMYRMLAFIQTKINDSCTILLLYNIGHDHVAA